MGLVAIVAVFERVDEHLDISGTIGFTSHGPAPRATPNVLRRLVALTTTAAPETVQVYPNDYVIGKYDGAGNEDWTNGLYSNAPVGNKIGIIVHIIGTLYMLVGLNTVCDIYFCGALDEMVEKWQVKPDVAGATFMAAGGSAPELFTSLIGAVITENDVGFGTIVGSAVFNVLAVIGCCGMSANEPIQLTWWPLFRDCTFYIIGLLVLAIFAYGTVIELPDGKKIGGGKIELYEAIVLFFLYLIYCTIMVFNEKLEKSISAMFVGKAGAIDQVAPMPAGETEDTKATDLREGAQAVEAAPGPPEHHIGISGGAEKATADVEKPAAVPEFEMCPITKEKKPIDKALAHHLKHMEHKNHKAHHHHEHHVTPAKVQSPADAPPLIEEAGAEKAPTPAEAAAIAKAPLAEPAPGAGEEEAESEASEDDILGLITKPEDTKDAIMWALCLPIYAGLYYTVPRPSPKMFLGTFVVSLLWIAGYSFWLVYCIEMFGKTVFGEGDNVVIVMSFTVLAAGTSIPDLVSSMAVARAGEGDMAVSSSIGSNIFDILVGLPIPWVLKIGVVEMAINGKSDYAVLIKSPYIALYVFLLLFMVAAVIISIKANSWQLNKKLGIFMAVLYFVFLCIVLPVEIINKGPYV